MARLPRSLRRLGAGRNHVLKGRALFGAMLEVVIGRKVRAALEARMVRAFHCTRFWNRLMLKKITNLLMRLSKQILSTDC